MNSPIGKSNFYVYCLPTWKLSFSCCLKTSRSVLENEKVFFFMPCLCQNFFWLASWIIDLYVICRACATARPLKTMERNFAVLFWAWKLFSTLFFSHFLFLFKSHFVKLDNVSGAYFFPILNYGAKVPFEGPFLSLFPVKPFVEEKGHKHVDFQLFRTKILLERACEYRM